MLVLAGVFAVGTVVRPVHSTVVQLAGRAEEGPVYRSFDHNCVRE